MEKLFTEDGICYVINLLLSDFHGNLKGTCYSQTNLKLSVRAIVNKWAWRSKFLPNYSPIYKKKMWKVCCK